MGLASDWKLAMRQMMHWDHFGLNRGVRYGLFGIMISHGIASGLAAAVYQIQALMNDTIPDNEVYHMHAEYQNQRGDAA